MANKIVISALHLYGENLLDFVMFFMIIDISLLDYYSEKLTSIIITLGAWQFLIHTHVENFDNVSILVVIVKQACYAAEDDGDPCG